MNDIIGTENIFKRIGPPLKEVPADLRDSILADIESAKILMEITTLFTAEYTLTAGRIFKRSKKRKRP